ncbi:MAG: GspE/PulE family protein [Phycisphaerae bacterium]|nr:GspE/PulE family protein [Phycisphaerae bacterium]MDD5380367.1 GspE/PulE family protein [Phycisphaerae bacterium]
MKPPFTFERKRNSKRPETNSQSADDGLDMETADGQTRSCDKSQDGSADDLIRGLSNLYSPEEAGESHACDIADVLLDMGKLTPEVHSSLRQEFVSNGIKSASDAEAILLKTGLISADDILEAKASLYGLEFRHIKPEDVDKEAFEKLDIDFIRDNYVCPIAIEKGSAEGEILVVGTSEPANVFAIEDVKRQTRMELKVVVCSSEAIEAVCDSFKDEKIDYNFDDIISDMTDVEVVADQEKDFEDLEKMAGQSPVIKFVNYLINRAVSDGASDIHIEPKDKFTRIRCRIDGVLFEIMQSPLKMHSAVVSRIKIMSNLDISERRLPQDGKISIIVGGRGIDLRVSILPTNRGEKVVIRVLDSKSILHGLEQLGMEPKVMAAFNAQVLLPNGILLVTGPTGSGKSTTLYSALCQMDGDKLNISTVEDPVEYELGFCNQVQVNEKIGLDFASTLRSLLRQDPDVIMIGEIRDSQTAQIAVRAALTGHLVLSTLHTNDAASSVTRLVDIGIDAYLIAASLNAVLAQRLVRKICPKCKQIYHVPKNMRKYMESAGIDHDQIFHGAGCDYCRGSGYAGRVGIYELLVVDEKFRDVINKDPSLGNMRRIFYESKQPSLFDDGMTKIKHGLTTIDEVLRVTKMYSQSGE